VSANFVARFDGERWQSLGAGAANGTNKSVSALAVDEGNLYIGGLFGTAGGQVSSNFATFLQPFAVVSSEALVFGGLEPGESSAPAQLIVGNAGSSVLEITALSLEASGRSHSPLGSLPFIIESDACTGAILAMDQTCTLEIVFTPSSAGLQQAVLQIGSDASNGPTRVDLVGNETPIFSDRFESSID
jgi:hypothetical protein